MSLLWWFLPDEAIPLVIAGIGLALIAGFISRGAAFRTVGLVVLALLMLPFVPAILGLLPGWLLLLLLVFIAISFFRSTLGALIGERAAAHTIGILVADLIRLCFRLLFLPLRLVLWAARLLLRPRGI